MNNSKMSFRSDLAKECIESVYKENKYDADGIKVETDFYGGVKIERVKISDEKGAEKIGKSIGRYVSIEVGDLKNQSRYRQCEVSRVCADELSRLLPEGRSCLVAALGNRAIAADSQGPICAENLIVTRHLKSNAPSVFTSLSLFELSCIVPDVLGNTGIESADVIKHVADCVKPDFIIAIDSLAASKSSRIGRVLQITDTGIAPGSGIGNRRSILNEKSIGVPVIAMGIPTVADAVTVAADVLERSFSSKSEDSENQQCEGIIRSVLGNGSEGFFLTPKDTDKISTLCGQLLGLTVNMALNPLLSDGEIFELIGR